MLSRVTRLAISNSTKSILKMPKNTKISKQQHRFPTNVGNSELPDCPSQFWPNKVKCQKVHILSIKFFQIFDIKKHVKLSTDYCGLNFIDISNSKEIM